jgi:hypothetical protein
MDEEIEIGSRICSKLKRIYFIDEPWVKSRDKVAIKFSTLKSKMKEFYSHLSAINILKELDKYSDKDLIECFLSK